MESGPVASNQDFKVFKVIEFFKSPFNSFRAEICEIGGKPYVGLAKFWKPEGLDEYIPTRKSIFLNPEQWRALGLQAKNVNTELSTFVNLGMISILLANFYLSSYLF